MLCFTWWVWSNRVGPGHGHKVCLNTHTFKLLAMGLCRIQVSSSTIHTVYSGDGKYQRGEPSPVFSECNIEKLGVAWIRG